MIDRILFVIAVSTACLLPLTTASQTSLGVANSPGFPGSTVPIAVSLRRATNVTAAQFDLAYNTNKVTSGELGQGIIFSNHVVRTREIEPGLRRVLIYSRTNAAVTVTNARVAAQIPFTIRATERVGSGPIVPGNVRLARPDATSIAPVALSSGAIFVQSIHYQDEGAQLFLPSEIGATYVVEATTNFVQWTDISTNIAFGNYLDAIDPFATNYPYRFYRSRRDP